MTRLLTLVIILMLVLATPSSVHALRTEDEVRKDLKRARRDVSAAQRLCNTKHKLVEEKKRGVRYCDIKSKPLREKLEAARLKLAETTPELQVWSVVLEKGNWCSQQDGTLRWKNRTLRQQNLPALVHAASEMAAIQEKESALEGRIEVCLSRLNDWAGRRKEEDRLRLHYAKQESKYKTRLNNGKKKRDGLLAELKHISEEAARRAAVPTAGDDLGLDDFSKLKGKLKWPIKGPVYRSFGEKYKSPGSTRERVSSGLDISAPLGSPIHAVAAGLVVHLGEISGYGNVLILDHGKRYYSFYANIDQFMADVKEGVVIDAGQQIATLGKAGRDPKPHLHYELRYDDPAKGAEAINPKDWLLPRK
jgi:murein DD-endopeptidase MepM/ murein hydrolase activator NlpD